MTRPDAMLVLSEVPLFKEQAWRCLISKSPMCMVEFHTNHVALSPHLCFFKGDAIKKLTSGQQALLFSAMGNNVPNAVEGDAQGTFLGHLHALIRVLKGDLILLFFHTLEFTSIHQQCSFLVAPSPAAARQKQCCGPRLLVWGFTKLSLYLRLLLCRILLVQYISIVVDKLCAR
jgi:hypothetical protein